MDALYVFRHSVNDDLEIRCSLRSIQKHAPYIRKVWIFGDRPAFLSDDTTLVQHVPHSYVTRIGNHRTPVTNFFLMLFLSSLIPELDFEFLWFCDDFFFLRPFPLEEARKVRFLQDLAEVKNRGSGLWLDSLWRTYDLLKRLGYTGYNFETHTPTYYKRKWVFEAYGDLRDFVTEDRWYGLLGPTAILNHAFRQEHMDLVHIETEGSRAGSWGKPPPTYEDVVTRSRGKTFLNFDDDAFGEGLRRFLFEQFPERSCYERPDIGQGTPTAAAPTRSWSWYPPIIMSNRDGFPGLLNREGLEGEGVEVGVQEGKYAAAILKSWKGRRLHCIDPWSDMTADRRYIDIANVSQQEQDRRYQVAIQRLAVFGDRSQIHRATSQEAARRFADASLDFVYLDARHFRAGVLEDLTLWAPKVRPSGYLAGHDYLDGVLPSGKFEVKSTVDEWAAQRRLQVACSGEHVWRSWFVRM